MSAEQEGAPPASAGGAPVPEPFRRMMWVAAEDIANVIGCTVVGGEPHGYGEPDPRDAEIERLRADALLFQQHLQRAHGQPEVAVTSEYMGGDFSRAMVDGLRDGKARADRDLERANEQATKATNERNDLRAELAKIRLKLAIELNLKPSELDGRETADLAVELGDRRGKSIAHWKDLAEQRGRQLDQRDKDERQLIAERNRLSTELDGQRADKEQAEAAYDRLRQELDLIGKSANDEFLTAEAAFWRRKYQGLHSAVDALTGAHEKYHHEVPPPPPVGTAFATPGGTTWTRKADGWHCSREGCVNCPADWESEVWDRVRAGTVRHLPGTRAAAEPRRWVAGDPEPAVGTKVRRGDLGVTFTRRTNGSWGCDDRTSTLTYSWDQVTSGTVVEVAGTDD